MALSSAQTATPAGTDIVCPTCKCELQVTASIWLSVLPDGTVVSAFLRGDNVSEEMKWYCARDHDTSGVAFDQGLYDRVRDYLEARIA